MVEDHKFRQCPFCGSWDVHPASKEPNLHWVVCHGCQASTGIYRKAENAKAAWNKRAVLHEEEEK